MTLHLQDPSPHLLPAFANTNEEALEIFAGASLMHWEQEGTLNLQARTDHRDAKDGGEDLVNQHRILLSGLPEKLSFRQIRFKLEAAGFNEIKQLNNHAKFIRRKNSVTRTAVMPHYTEISRSTMRSIIKQAGLSKVEFDSL